MRKTGSFVHDHLRSNIVGYCALFVAMSGTAWAVSVASIDTQDIAKHAVTKPKIANQAVGSGKVENRSLQGKDVADDTLTGRQVDEATLALGDLTGPPGPPGTFGTVVNRDLLVPVPGTSTAAANVGCDPGEIVIGGLARPITDGDPLEIDVSRPTGSVGLSSSPSNGNSMGAWRGQATNTGGTTKFMVVSVFCAS